MADSESTGSTGIVAIFAILVVVVIAGFLAWRAGVVAGSGDHESLDITGITPSSR